MQATGTYPINSLTEAQIEELIAALAHGCANRPIKKILIGEAPPASGAYFYDPINWSHSQWEYAPYRAIFGHLPGAIHKTIFLTQMAAAGFLLLDLFPYAISFSGNRNSPTYTNACISAFRNGHGAYPINIMSTLGQLNNCISKSFSIAFGLKLFGEAILNDIGCIADFTHWAVHNSFTLLPAGAVNVHRNPMIPQISNYLRIVLRNMNPNASLLNHAGF